MLFQIKYFMIKYLHGDIMNSLKFQLKTDNEEVINENINYLIKNNLLTFKIENDMYSFNLESNIFIKKNQESVITMDFENYNIIIEIPENNLMFNMEIIEYNIVRKERKIEITYKYMSDKITTNNILIEY